MNIREVLASLYPGQSDGMLTGIDEMLERYGPIRAPDSVRLTARDSIMITYGDAFRVPGSAPLEGLRQFAVQQLGDLISAIHLLPCFPYSSDDGFSVKDYYQIDPDLGDWGDVERLGQSYDLMFDAVVNHISQHSEWFRKFLAADPAFDDFFLVGDPDADYGSVVRPRALPLLHPYEQNGRTVYVWTTFSSDQIDLNFATPRVFLQILDVLLFYVSRGARYIRLDAIAFLWKRLGTSCIHLPETHRVIQLYRELIGRVAPHVVIITETNVPHEENISYFGDGRNEAHMVYNFTLPPLLMHSLHQQDVCVLTRWARSLELPSDEVCFFNFTASHDGVGVRPLQGIVSDAEIDRLVEIAQSHGGFVSMRSHGDGSQSPYEINCNYFDFATSPDAPAELRIQRFLLTQSVMLTMPGVPGIYYHSLIGSQNDRQAALESGINRRINRAKLDYPDLAQQLDTPTTIRHRVLSRYKQLLAVRREQPAFDPYGPADYECQGPVFVIRRFAREERVIAVHNFSDRQVTVEQLPEDMVDLISGEPVIGGKCRLKPFEYRWLK